MLVIVTIVSTLAALIASVIAIRATREERRRSAARVAALARAIHGDAETPAGAGDRLFADAGASSSGSRWGIAFAAGAFVVATLAAVAVVVSGGGSSSEVVARSATPPATEATIPIELLALVHEREGNALTVRGVVRNPPGGSEKDGLTAIVSLFNRDGNFLMSARAAVESSALIPGGESTFIVTVPAAPDVGRYRVSFQAADQVVAHVDKRSRS